MMRNIDLTEEEFEALKAILILRKDSSLVRILEKLNQCRYMKNPWDSGMTKYGGAKPESKKAKNKRLHEHFKNQGIKHANDS